MYQERQLAHIEGQKKLKNRIDLLAGIDSSFKGLRRRSSCSHGVIHAKTLHDDSGGMPTIPRSSYQLEEQAGRGSFGVVHRARVKGSKDW